jgi:hypothetical protein
MGPVLSILTESYPETPFNLAKGQGILWIKSIAKSRGISGSMWGILILLLSVSLTSCAPQKKHDHAIFGPTDKGNGTGYDNNNP